VIYGKRELLKPYGLMVCLPIKIKTWKDDDDGKETDIGMVAIGVATVLLTQWRAKDRN